LLSAIPAFAGKYQRTLDKKSHIWNDDPKPWEECNWTGGRDRLNLADGPGTLVWYHAERGPVPRVQFMQEKLHFASRLTGTMLRGRWEGIVESQDANGRISHARFDNGKPLEGWIEGPAPETKATESKTTEVEAPETRAAEQRSASTGTPPVEIVSQPAREPAPVVSRPEPVAPVVKSPPDATRHTNFSSPVDFSIEPKPLIQGSSSVAVQSTPVPTKSMLTSSQPASSRSSGSTLLTEPIMPSASSGGGGAGDLFHSLAAPPTLLQHHASLAPREVTKIAEAELAAQGLKLADYPRRQLTYNPENDSWFVSYEHGAGNDSLPGPSSFGVTVDDKTGKATTTR
jgi:hypothetical protein